MVLAQGMSDGMVGKFHTNEYLRIETVVGCEKKDSEY